MLTICWALWELSEEVGHKPVKNETAGPNTKKTKEEITGCALINCQMVKIKTSQELKRSGDCLTPGAESEADLIKKFSLDSVQTMFFSFHHLPFSSPQIFWMFGSRGVFQAKL